MPSVGDFYSSILHGPGPSQTRAVPGMPAPQRNAGIFENDPIGGFLASTFSAIPEFIGAQPDTDVEAWRATHPVGSFVSQAVPILAPYAGAEMALTRIPRLAEGLAGLVTRVGGAVEHPIRAGIVRNLVAMNMVDIPRLAIGGLSYPENMGSLFGDVVFGQALGGGLGAVGGLFRLAGPRAAAETRAAVQGATEIASPTLQLQMLRNGAEPVDASLGREGTARTLVNEVFAEQVGRSGVSNRPIRSVAEMEGATGPAHTAEVNTAFSLSRSNDAPLLTQSLVERDGNAYPGNIDSNGRAELIQNLRNAGAAISNDEELAAATIHPRLITAQDGRGAGIMGRMLSSPVFNKVDDNLWLGREQGDGLYVGVMRVRRGATHVPATTVEEGATEGATRYVRPKGGAAVGARSGDQYLLFKTNQPGAFSPRNERLLRTNYSEWAGVRAAYRPDLFESTSLGREQNRILGTLRPQDFNDLHRMSRQTWVSQLSQRVTQRMGAASGISDSEAARTWAEGIYDMVAPTMFKQGKSSMFARLDTMRRVGVRWAERNVHDFYFGRVAPGSFRNMWRYVGGRRYEPVHPEGTFGRLIHDMSPDDWEMFIRANASMTPAKDLEKISADGVVSEQTRNIIDQLQRLKARFDQEHVLPEMQAAGIAHKFNMLEGYIGEVPRLGEFFQKITDESGNLKWIVTGRNAAHLRQQVRPILEEAERAGLRWKAPKTEFFGQSEAGSVDDITELFKDSLLTVGVDQQAHDVVQRAMQRVAFKAHPTARATKPSRREPGFLSNERSGKTLVVDVPTKREFLEQMFRHDMRLAKFAAMQHTLERFAPEVTRLQKYDPTLAENFNRMVNQTLGIEGQITNSLNKALQPLLGPVMGSKPATRIAQATNNLMYKFNLAWFNPTFAMLNALTPLMTAVPEAAFVLSSVRRAAADGLDNARMLRHYQMLPLIGETSVDAIGHLSPLKVLWNTVRNMRKLDDEQQAIIRQLVHDGDLGAHLDEHFGHGASGPKEVGDYWREGDYARSFDRSATWMARKSEELTRAISGLMGINLGRDVLGLSGDRLLEFSRRFIHRTNYLYAVTDRPRIFTGPVGSIFGLFKTWQAHYLGMMLDYGRVAWKEGVYSPLMWQLAVAGGIGGVGATPLRHLADGLSNWYDNDPHSYRWMSQHWPNAADEIWFGLPAFLGVSLQTSAAIPGTDVRNEITNLGNVVAYERATQFAQAIGNARALQSATGQNPLRDPNIRDQLIAATMPRAISRLVSTVEGDHVTSMRTGYPQVRDVGIFQRALHGLGLNQVEVERYQQAGRELYRDQQRQRALVTGLGEEYAQAALRHDTQTARLVVARAMALGVPLSSIAQSQFNFQRREAQGDVLSRYDRLEGQRWRQAFEAGGEGP